jgi:hypothetical protein
MRLSMSLVLAILVVGCNTAGQGPPTPASTGAATSSAQATGGVARIVFVGQREACDCTKNRIATTWKALETALADRKDLPVEKLELDVDQAKAEQYEQLQPLMTAPGVYLLDGKDGLVKMLQGELTVAQLTAAIGTSPGSS